MKTIILILATALLTFSLTRTIFPNKSVAPQVDRGGYSFSCDTLNGKPVFYYQKILQGNPVVTVDSVIQRSFTIVDSVTYGAIDKNGNDIPRYKTLTVLSVEVDSTYWEFIGNNPLPYKTGSFNHKYIVVDNDPL